MSKKFRRSIRIKGEPVKSPLFLTKREADAWYNQKYSERAAMRGGIFYHVGAGPQLREYFYLTWLPKRKRNYPESTWASDVQRFEKYIQRILGGKKVSKINTLEVKACLADVVDKHGADPKTRDRVRSLLSKVFKDAMNEAVPLTQANPVAGIQFDGRRRGKKTPKHLKAESEAKRLLWAAKKDVSPAALPIIAILMMAALRKSEMLPLLIEDVDFKRHAISVNKRYTQVSKKIERGTKSGDLEGREVPMSDELERILKEYLARRPNTKPTDFLLPSPEGGHYKPRGINTLVKRVCEAVGLDVPPHGLRHSHGRLFIASGGNKKVLQANLGHASSATTDLYADLAGVDRSAHRNLLNLETDDE